MPGSSFFVAPPSSLKYAIVSSRFFRGVGDAIKFDQHPGGVAEIAADGRAHGIRLRKASRINRVVAGEEAGELPTIFSSGKGIKRDVPAPHHLFLLDGAAAISVPALKNSGRGSSET